MGYNDLIWSNERVRIPVNRKPSILIIEDEEAIRQGLIDLFAFKGFDVQACAEGERGLKVALSGHHDCILLDVMMPGRDGFSICNDIRTHSRQQPIIMLTAKNSEDDIINGLSLGADDYISKPFSIRELVLRVEAVIRRSRPDLEGRQLMIGDEITIDVDKLTGTIRGKTEIFTRREVDILSYLMLNRHKASSRGDLLTHVWHYNNPQHLDTRTVDIHMAKLRKKIELKPKSPLILKTVRGEGYRIEC